MNPFVTVIIPAHNASATIGETLASVALQTDRDLSVRIVDDRSSDGTYELANRQLAEFGLAGTVFRLRDEHGRGPAAARNYATQGIASEWLAFLDADDLWHPERVAALREAGAKWPHAGMMRHNAEQFDDTTGAVLPTPGDIVEDGTRDLFADLLTRNPVTTSTVAVRPAVFAQAGGFDTRLSGPEDWHLWLRLSLHATWGEIARPLTRYRVRAGSLMIDRPLAHYAERYAALLRVVRDTEEFGERPTRQIRQTLGDLLVRHHTERSVAVHGWPTTLKGVLAMQRLGFGEEARILTKRFALLAGERVRRRLLARHQSRDPANSS